MCLAALLGGILNSHNRFAAMATMPIILNIWMIVFVVFRPSFMSFNSWLGLGILIAGFTQFLFLFVVCWHFDIRFRLLKPRITPMVKRFGQKMLPGLLGAGVYQLNVIIDTALASRLPSGSISYLHYADRFIQLPLAVIGIAPWHGFITKPKSRCTNQKQPIRSAHSVTSCAYGMLIWPYQPVRAYGFWVVLLWLSFLNVGLLQLI